MEDASPDYSTPPPVTKPFIPKNVLSLGALVLLLLILDSGLIITSRYRKQRPPVRPIPTSYPVHTLKPTSYPVISTPQPTSTPAVPRRRVTYDFSQITWYPAERKIAILPLFTDHIAEDIDEIKYYQVATLPGNRYLYDVIFSYQAMGTYYEITRFVQEPNGDFNYLGSKPNAYLEGFLRPGIGYSTSLIPSLESPEKLISNNINYELSNSNNLFFSDIIPATKLADSPSGPLYISYIPAEKIDLYYRNIYLRLPDNTVKSYDIEVPFLAADYKINLQFTDGTSADSNTYTYVRLGQGCGSIGGNSAVFRSNSASLSGKVYIARSTSGQNLYQVTDPTSTIVKSIYQEDYLIGRDASETDVLSLSDFAKTKNHLLWQDPLGDWHLLMSTSFSRAAECAKPVIYLYPTTATPVSVKVGARVRLSDPLYPRNGWQVTAHPDGTLIYQTKTYPYLFWEGTGIGPYPDISRYGFVVPQSQISSTLKNHLALLGLNAKESADFLDYWLPLMPTTPYVRLTWLTTVDMNRLVPLTVTPQPDTTIRVFLDFAGLLSPVNLVPQKLSAPARTGFTLVEWGGLLQP